MALMFAAAATARSAEASVGNVNGLISAFWADTAAREMVVTHADTSSN
jgi:hypothetical protein